MPCDSNQASRSWSSALDLADGPLHPLVARHVVGRRKDDQVVDVGQLLAGERVDRDDPLDLVAEQLDLHHVLLVGGMDLDGVAPDPKLAPHQVQVVALVLHVDQPAQHRPLVLLLADLQVQDPVRVLLGRPQPVDAGDRGDHDDIPAGQQGGGRRVAQPVDLVVDRAVLLDVGVARGEVGLGLVVVVVGDEVLHPVLGEELPELVGQLGGQRLVGGDDQGRALDLLDRPGDGGALAASGDAEQRLEAVPPPDALGQGGDRVGLVSGRTEIGLHHERRHVAMLPGGCDNASPPVVTRRRRRASGHSGTSVAAGPRASGTPSDLPALG